MKKYTKKLNEISSGILELDDTNIVDAIDGFLVEREPDPEIFIDEEYKQVSIGEIKLLADLVAIGIQTTYGRADFGGLRYKEWKRLFLDILKKEI